MNLDNIKNVPWEKVREKLPDLIASYEQDIIEAPPRLSIRGKIAAEAYKEQTAWPIYYGTRKAEVAKLLKYIEAQVGACRSRLYRKYTEQYSRDLGERARERYIDNEPEFLAYHELYLEVEELFDKLTAACEAFDRRGFYLRDWTSLAVASLQQEII